MQDYTHFDEHLKELNGDVYPQPPDPLQQEYGEEVINKWLAPLSVRNVLDVGCGQGQFAEAFKTLGIEWHGVTLGTDYEICKSKGLEVYQEDFTFINWVQEDYYDLVFARHALEHSPFPLITLMEWNRVSNGYLCVILPNPLGLLGTSHVGAYKGRNHYSVMTKEHFAWLAERAGWRLLKFEENDFEIRFLMMKGYKVIE